MSALRRRAIKGGSYRVVVSLARVILWLLSRGIFDKKYAQTTAGSSDEHTYVPPDLFTADTPLGLSTIDMDIENDPHAFQALKNYVANMILVLVKNKSDNIDYEQVINEISSHIMTFCVGYKTAMMKS